MGWEKEVEIEEFLEEDGRILDTLIMKHDFEMGIVGCYNIEDVGEVGGVANEFENGCKFFSLKTVNVVNGDNNWAIDMLEGISNVIVKLLKGFIV